MYADGCATHQPPSQREHCSDQYPTFVMVFAAVPGAALRGGGGYWKRKGRGGGGGGVVVWDPKLVDQNWPDKIFPMANHLAEVVRSKPGRRM